MLPLTKRQREILDYLNEFIQQHGYAPSLEEIGRRFNLSSLATVHKHLTNLQEKGFIRRAWNRSRSVELVQTRVGSRAVELPLLGPSLVAASSFAFVVSMGEFGATLVISRPEFATLPVAIFDRLGRPGPNNSGSALVLAVVLMLLTGGVILLLDRYGRSEM